jgi:hypothetical protein
MSGAALVPRRPLNDASRTQNARHDRQLMRLWSSLTEWRRSFFLSFGTTVSSGALRWEACEEKRATGTRRRLSRAHLPYMDMARSSMAGVHAAWLAGLAALSCRAHKHTCSSSGVLCSWLGEAPAVLCSVGPRVWKNTGKFSFTTARRYTHQKEWVKAVRLEVDFINDVQPEVRTKLVPEPSSAVYRASCE